MNLDPLLKRYLNPTKGKRWTPCPACGGEEHGDGRGPVRLFEDGKLWTCDRCNTTGDAWTLVCWGENQEAPPPKGDPRWSEDRWRNVVAILDPYGIDPRTSPRHEAPPLPPDPGPPPESVHRTTAELALTWTWWPSQYKPHAGEEHAATWRDLAEMIDAPIPMPRGGKDALPMWTCGRFGAMGEEDAAKDEKQPGAHYRDLAHHQGSGALVIDYDSSPELPEDDPKRGSPELEAGDLWECWRRWCYLAHTTPSHRPGRARWRLVLPLAREVDEPEYRRLARWAIRWGSAHGAPGLDADTGWCQPSLAFNVPAQGEHYEHASNEEGEALDVDAALHELATWEHEDAMNEEREKERDADPFAGAWRSIAEWGEEAGAGWLDAGAEPPPVVWLLKRPERGDDNQNRPVGLLPLGKVGMLAAAGGAGKTMALCELALAVATGGRWLGCIEVASPGNVLLALGEEDAGEARRRLWNAARFLELTDEDRRNAAGRIVVLPLAGNPHMALTKEEDATGVEMAAAKLLREHLAENEEGWSLVILDPASRFAGGEAEKSTPAATRFVQVLETLAATPGTPAVLVAHHTSQAARQTGAGDATAARGVTAFSDAVRWQATLVNRKRYDGAPDLVGFEMAKNNYAKPWDGLVLRRHTDRGGMLRQAKQEDLENYRLAKVAREAKAKAEKVREKEEKAANPNPYGGVS